MLPSPRSTDSMMNSPKSDLTFKNLHLSATYGLSYPFYLFAHLKLTRFHENIYTFLCDCKLMLTSNTVGSECTLELRVGKSLGRHPN